jgi:hypothetical protein
MGTICGVKQRFCSGGNITFAVQQQVPNFLTELCATWFKGSDNLSATALEPGLEQV